MRYFILVKRKGSSRYSGAIPIKKGASISKVISVIRKQMNKNYSFKIVSINQLKGMLLRLKKRYRKRR